MTQKQKALWVTTLISLSILVGCGKQANEDAGDDQMTMSPSLVSVLPVNPETVILTDELPGRVSAARVAEIRPQVGGIIEKRLFEEGADVRQGQPLFQIFAEPFQADVASAAAALQRTEAVLIRAQGKLDRSTQLIKANAISREAFEDASAELAQAKASVAEAKATLSRRKLDLEFATVRAPISGRIGQALISEGALVSAANSNALATIQQIDKVYVDVRQPASQIDVIRDAIVSGQLDDASRVPVAIFGASGKRYSVGGRALFSDISVDPSTGNVSTRVTVDNVDTLLLPGMYVRARLPRGVRHDALLVPQEAILRTPSGQAQLMVLDAKNHGSRRDVELSETVQGRTIVSSGLTSGETVVIQGQDRVQPDTPLEVIPFGKSQPLLQN